MSDIVQTEDILGGDPRIDGTRIGVLHVYELAVEEEYSPADVADQFDISLTDVYTALAYYHEHPEEMREIREAHEEAETRLAEKALAPSEATQ